MLRVIIFGLSLGCALAGSESLKYFTIEETQSENSNVPDQPDIYSSERLNPIGSHESGSGLPYKLSFADYAVTWESFKKTHNKQYATEEDERHRYGIFLETVNFIEEHNWKYHNGHSSYYMNINQFSDLTDEEYRMLHSKCEMKSTSSIQRCKIYAPKSDDVPDSLDWRLKGYVTGVKDQGDCGSCWSFSTTGVIEGQWFNKSGKLIPLSEQQLIDCAGGQFHNYGCNGGFTDYAFSYLFNTAGLESEESYPYEAKDGKCRFDKNKVAATISSCYYVYPQYDEDRIKIAVGNIGPVAAVINADSPELKSYSGGVFDLPTCNMTFNHGILITGYGSMHGKDYWIVKNSWNANWGMGGYAYMSRNKENQCGISTWISFALV